MEQAAQKVASKRTMGKNLALKASITRATPNTTTQTFSRASFFNPGTGAILATFIPWLNTRTTREKDRLTRGFNPWFSLKHGPFRDIRRLDA